MSGWRKVGKRRRPGTTSGRRGGEKRGRRKQRKREEKKRAVEEKDPPLSASSWAGHLQGLSLTAALRCWPGSQGPPTQYACPAPCRAAQLRGPRLAPRASPPRALLLQSARARAHIHTLALRACAVGGAAPGRLLLPRVGSASAGRRAVSERGASQRAREPERARGSQREPERAAQLPAPSSAAPARLSPATAATTAPQHRHLGRRPRPPRPSPAAAPRRRQEVVGGDHG